MRTHRSQRRRRRLTLAVTAVAVVGVAVAVGVSAIGGASSGERRATAPSAAPPPKTPQRTERPAGSVRIERFTVGSGARAAVVLRPQGGDRKPGVIFVHGWGQDAFANYAGWLRHLARRGNTVIAPRYQLDTNSDPKTYLPNAIAGIRAALGRAPVEQGSLVLAGHSAGGALAVDYAAVAARENLPVPRAVLAVYPGRALRAFPGGIPAEDESRIAPSTRLVAMAGANDQVVGDGPAAQIVAQASTIAPERRKLIRVTDPAVSDHYGPERSIPSARAAFWRPFDELTRLARNDG